MLLGRAEIAGAVTGLINNPENVLIPLDIFKSQIHPGAVCSIVKWYKEKGLLAFKTIENCGTVKKATVVAWTEKGVELKNKHSQDIGEILQNLNEGKIV